MDFNLSPEDRELVELVERVAFEKFRPTAFQFKEGHNSRPLDNLKLLAELGILGLCMPPELGGSGRPILSGILAIEQISRACPRTGSATLFAISGPPKFIADWGTDQQRQKYIPGVLAGETTFSISLSEPDAGTALTDLKTYGVIEGDACIINGQKVFCTNANLNDYILMFCRFAPGASGIGAVILSKDTPGLTISKPHEHLNGTPWCELFLDNARIPVEDVLFTTGGFQRLMANYSLERTATGAMVLGVAQTAFDMAKEHAVNRKQFGRPIADFQFVQGRLAEMYLRIEQARLLLYKAAAVGEGGKGRLLSSAAKVASTEAAVFATDQAMQIFGGSGMSKEMPLEWLYRYVRPYTIAGGTNDIMRSMIVSELLDMRFDHRGVRRDDAGKGR